MNEQIVTINNLTKEQAINLAFKIGFEGEANRTNCAQETFHAITTVLGYRNPLIFKSLSALEGGSAVTTYGNCGAFSGALIVFGFFFGRTYEQWEEGKSYIKSTILGQKLFKKFISQYNSIICREIHKKIYGRTFNLMDEENLGINKEQLAEFEKMGAHTIKCPTVVGLSAAWAVEILWDLLPKDKDISNIPDINNAVKNLNIK